MLLYRRNAFPQDPTGRVLKQIQGLRYVFFCFLHGHVGKSLSKLKGILYKPGFCLEASMAISKAS